MIRRRHLGLGLALLTAPLVVRADDPSPGTPEYVRASTEALLEIAAARSDEAAAIALATFADRNLETLRAQSRAGNADAARAAAEAQEVLEKGLSELAHRVAAGEDGSLKDLVAAATKRHVTVLQSLLDSGQVPDVARPAIERALSTSLQGHGAATGAVPAQPRGAVPAGPPNALPPAGPPALPPQAAPALPPSVPSLPR